MTEEAKPITRLVVNQEQQPCGCRIVEYADKRKEISPCLPCGLMDVARNLQGSAQALAAVATRVRADSLEAGRAMLAAAAKKVV